MFLEFFYLLRENKIPASLPEYLTLLEALDKKVIGYSIDDFYFLCRSILVKHERFLDRFDQLFGKYFKGIEYLGKDIMGESIPEEWLRKNLERILTEAEMEAIKKLGGLEALMKRFEELMKTQKERHEGGDTWIGTGGTSPYGAFGFNPEGFRMGQNRSRHRRAIKVWDKRDFMNLDDRVELNTRNIKMALKRLRVFTREGLQDELDIDETIRKTSDNAGYLDIVMQPSKQNRVKILMLIDIGGSMDDHIEICSRLFSAARYEFKYLEYYYFHNCLYDYVWRDNQRRESDRLSTWDLLNKYNKDYKIIFLGDAAMSPIEIMYKGGSAEYWNEEPGIVWLNRIKAQYPYMAWINPNPEQHWQYFESTRIIKEFTENRMFPMTVEGIAKTMRCLKHEKVKHAL